MSTSESPPKFEPAALNATAEQALETISAAGLKAPALVDQWVRQSNAAAVAEVARRGEGAARKAARRGLNVLKSRGIDIPHESHKATIQVAKAPVQAWLLAPDAAGIRLLAFSRKLPGGGCTASLIFLRDGQGIVKVENSHTSPTKLKASLDKVMPGSGYGPVEVPVDWARHKVASTRAVHTKKKLPEPLGMTTAEPLIATESETAPEHPFDSEGFEFSSEDATELAKDSGALHHLPEFRNWLPPASAVRQVIANVGAQLNPDTTPEQDKVTELLKAEMRAATDRYFNEDVRKELVGWMKDSGISLLAREGEQAALKVAATIQTISSCTLTTHPPQEVPFLSAFFEKGVSVMMAQQGGKLNIPVPKPASSES